MVVDARNHTRLPVWGSASHMQDVWIPELHLLTSTSLSLEPFPAWIFIKIHLIFLASFYRNIVSNAMSVGTIHANVALDEPMRICCGSEESVTGKLVLRFQSGPSNHSGELVGVLAASVILRGRAKTKIVRRSNDSHRVFRGRAPLFAQTFQIHNQPVQLQNGEVASIPFSLKFPRRCADMGDGRVWEPDPRFEDAPGHLLPPSMNVATRNIEAFVEYRIGAQVSIPHIDVKVWGLEEDRNPYLLYERPRVPVASMDHASLELNHRIVLQNKFLVPEEDRASGFKQKTKALFSSDFYPRYPFNILCQSPGHLYIGQPLQFQVQMRPDTALSTAKEIPAVTLGHFTATVKAFTALRAERGLFLSPESTATDHALQLTGKADDDGPFNAKSNWTKTITTSEVQGIASSFATYNISRVYALKVAMWIHATNKTTEIKREFQVMVHPPLDILVEPQHLLSQSGSANARAPSYAEAGPSGIMQEAQVAGYGGVASESELPPAYDKLESAELHPKDTHPKQCL